MRTLVRLSFAVVLLVGSILVTPSNASADYWCLLCERQDGCINLPHDPYCCTNCCLCNGGSLGDCQDYCGV